MCAIESIDIENVKNVDRCWGRRRRCVAAAAMATVCQRERNQERARARAHRPIRPQHVAASGVMVELWLFLIKDAYQSKLLCSVLFNMVLSVRPHRLHAERAHTHTRGSGGTIMCALGFTCNHRAARLCVCVCVSAQRAI